VVVLVERSVASVSPLDESKKFEEKVVPE
jgi:hypothetical protein